MLDGEGNVDQLAEPVANDATAAADANLDQAIDGALSEAPAERPSAPAKPTAPAAKPPAAQPRDTQGRFTEQPAAEEPAPLEESAPAPVPDEPAAEAEGQPAADDAEAEPEAETYPEISYRADGQEISIPGSAVGEEGDFIPATHRAEVRDLLALGRSAREGTIRQRLREGGEEAARLRTQIDSALQARDHIFATIEEMVEKGTFEEWLQDVQANWRVLKAEAIAKGKDLELAEERKQRETFEQTRERERREPQIKTALEKVVVHYGQAAKLTDAAMRQVFDRLNTPRFRDLVVVQAKEDDPRTGVKKGEWLLDYGVVQDEIEWFLKSGGGTVQHAADRVQQLAADNARRTGQPTKAPPVAPAKGAPPAGKVKIPDYKSAQEADEDIFDKGGYVRFGGG